jgi:hypothetical protein
MGLNNPWQISQHPTPLSSSNLTASSSNLSVTNTAQVPTAQSKWNISVEEWERKAPLTELQLEREPGAR